MSNFEQMTDDQIDEAIARALFGWTPVQCPADPEKIDSFGEYGNYICHVCDATTGDWAEASDLVHTIIPHGSGYASYIGIAWSVVERITQPPKTLAEAERAANTRFGYWFDRANLWAMSNHEAARAICIAALESVGWKESE